jgi:hypothetical protein
MCDVSAQFKQQFARLLAKIFSLAMIARSSQSAAIFGSSFCSVHEPAAVAPAMHCRRC